MLTNIETLSALERRVTFAVPAADIEREVEKRLQQMSRTVRVSGFRPGKVPMKMMNQQYGPQVRQEVTGDAVQRSFTEVVTSQQLRVAGYPSIERTLLENDPTAVAFSATFEVYPEVTLGDIQSQTISTPDLNVAEVDIDKTIDILRKQRVSFADVDRAAQAEDRVTIDFKGSIDGVEFPGGSGGDMPVVIGTGRMLPDVKNKVMEALIASTPLELPKALVEMESQRVMESAKADLEQRGIKMEQLPISPEVFQDQAKRRVTLGLIIGKLVEQHGLSAKPEQVRALVDDYAESYEQPAEVVKWAYSDPQRLAEFEGMAVEANVVAWVLQNAKVEKAATSFDELMGRTAG
jgi:trigger factor